MAAGSHSAIPSNQAWLALRRYGEKPYLRMKKPDRPRQVLPLMPEYRPACWCQPAPDPFSGNEMPYSPATGKDTSSF